MLSDQEKQEILNDARCAKRRASFRKAQVRQTTPSYDAYLKFLSRLQKVFTRAQESLTKTPKTHFKL